MAASSIWIMPANSVGRYGTVVTRISIGFFSLPSRSSAERRIHTQQYRRFDADSRILAEYHHPATPQSLIISSRAHDNIRRSGARHDFQIGDRRCRDISRNSSAQRSMQFEVPRPLRRPRRQQADLVANESLHQLFLQTNGGTAVVVNVRRPVVVGAFERRESIIGAVYQA